MADFEEPQTDMARIFQMDPNKCSDQDIELIVKEMRSKHNLWKLGVSGAGPTKAKPAAKPKEPNVKLDLSSLGIKLG